MELIPRREIEKFFERFMEDLEIPEIPVIPRLVRPSVDLYETDKEVIAEIEVPGVDPKSIKVSVEDNVLTVEGGEEKEVKEEKRGYFRQEIRKGYFKRSIVIPVEVQAEKAEAEYKNGVLRVAMPKVKEEKKSAKEIKIKVSK